MTIRLIDSRCESKALLRCRKPALTKAAHMAKALDEPIEAYHCLECHGYHLGHPRGWRRENGRLVRRSLELATRG